MRKFRRFSAVWVLAVALATLPLAGAHAQGPVVLVPTPYLLNGERALSAPQAFEVTDPSGAALELRRFQYTTPLNWNMRPPGSVNLWFVFHGGGGNSATMNRYFDAVPGNAPTVIVFPQALPGANGETRWRNVGYAGDEVQTDNYKDIIFIEQFRANLLASNPQLSGDNVYASGFSSGGSMTWMLLCYRSSLFQGFAMYSKQLMKGRGEGGCGDGRVFDPATGGYTTQTGYELLTGNQPDRYGYNPMLGGFAPTVPVLYQHGTLDDNLDYAGTAGCATATPPTCPFDEDPDNSMAGPGTVLEDRDDISTKNWLLRRHDVRPRHRTRVLPDQDPATVDMVVTKGRTYTLPAVAPFPQPRDQVRWLEMSMGVHAVSALDHEGDVRDNLTPPPQQTNCNANMNASKDYETSLETKLFFETFAGMM